MQAIVRNVFRGFVPMAALSLALLALAACGTSSEPVPTSPPAATEPPATAVAEQEPPATVAPDPSAKMAPIFELPNAKGETVSLASFAGDKNVVLVFYRGFW